MSTAKICRVTRAPFQYFPEDIELLAKFRFQVGDQFFTFPEPTCCPEYRRIRRELFSNERSLYIRNSSLSGQRMISMYQPNAIFPVWSEKEWYSDQFRPQDYGIPPELDRPIFPQFKKLLDTVPRLTRAVNGNENSDYCNHCGYMEDSYMTHTSGYCEGCYYGSHIINTKYALDSAYLLGSESCYSCLDCRDSQLLFHCWGVMASHHCSYLVDADGASYCFLSHSKVNTSFWFEDIKVTESEYHTLVEQFKKLSKVEQQKKIDAWQVRVIDRLKYPFHMSVQAYPGCSGAGLANVSNVQNSYDISDSENVRYSDFSSHLADASDNSGFGDHSSRMYEVIGTGTQSNGVYFSIDCVVNCSSIAYCYNIQSSQDCLLCEGLTNAQYCILNKQYTRSEYELLAPQVIATMQKYGEWGEFFDPTMSPFGYNESIAMLREPLSREDAIAKGFNWSDYIPPTPQVSKTIPALKLPERIEDIPDDILNWAILCEVSNKPFIIQPGELAFYRAHGMRVPTKHPDIRYKELLAKRMTGAVYSRSCMSPGCVALNGSLQSFETVISPERPEQVYCEKCYTEELVRLR